MYLIYNESLDMYYSSMGESGYPVWILIGASNIMAYSSQKACKLVENRLVKLEPQYKIYSVNYIRGPM